MRASCQPLNVNLNAFLCVSVPLWQVFDVFGRWHHGFRFDVNGLVLPIPRLDSVALVCSNARALLKEA